MSDTLVERLRESCRGGEKCVCSAREAADRIERLERELAEWRRLETDPAFVWSNMTRGIIATPKEIAEAKRDAERYRWLRGDVPTYSNRWPRWRIEHWQKGAVAMGWDSTLGEKLDSAIDAAIAQEAGK